MDPIVHSLHLSLQNGSWWVMVSMFISGLILSFNPCMGAMIPLVFGGSRQTGFGKSIQFILGFVFTLMLLGAFSAGVGTVFRFPGRFWIIFLGGLYLVAGAILLGFKFPLRISGFYVTKQRLSFQNIYNNEGLSPWILGIFFALAPSPCTTPVILMVSGVAIASGKILVSAVALGAFGLGHSILLALAFIPAVRKLLRVNSLTNRLRMILGAILIVLAGYFLIVQPDLFNNGMLGHNHE
jgi:cytochrome c-type biogenesis protein